MKSIKILNANIVNDGRIFASDVLIANGFIERIGGDLSTRTADITIDASGKYLLPGVIDDQVHFREPGLTHKAEIFTEARAAVAGGITSYMEMPNTIPNAVTLPLLEDKYLLAGRKSLANYSFYLGATNDNIDELLKADPKRICGIKIFMGSSTGNMLVDDMVALEKIFASSPMLIATHCEDEEIIRSNTEQYRKMYGENVPMDCHPKIRTEEACLKSSSLAVALAKKHGSRLHVLHISTARETHLFDGNLPLEKKRITAEACVHHVWFDDRDYREKGSLIKWNPAVKTEKDKLGILSALKSGRIDVLATDHAPHTLSEKTNSYFSAPSGGPLVQHALVAMLEFYHKGQFTLPEIVEKMCHNPALIFNIDRRGFVKEGYWADLVLVDMDDPWAVEKKNILYKCGWSPFEGHIFRSKITHTVVSGHLAYEQGRFDDSSAGRRLQFNRI